MEPMNFQIAYRRYRRVFRRPLRTAHGDWKIREGFLVRIESEKGVGYGEVAPIPDFGTETIERAEDFLNKWADDPIIMPSGMPCCLFALTMAMKGAEASQGASGIPIDRSGGLEAELPAMRDYRVAGLLPAGTDALSAAKEKSIAGYTTLKWKVGLYPAEAEIEILEDLLALLPGSVSLRLDANGGLNESQFKTWLEALAPHRRRIDYFEQPLAPGNEALMAELARGSDVEIALDESLNGSRRDQWLVPKAWDGPLVIKPLLMGNVTALMEQLRPLAAQLVLSSVFETGCGLSLVLSLGDMLPAMNRAVGFDTLSAFDDSLSCMAPGPQIFASERATINLEHIWQQLAP